MPDKPKTAPTSRQWRLTMLLSHPAVVVGSLVLGVMTLLAAALLGYL
jgi:hypothetical protein